jgi:hypothetical protein
MRTSPDVKVSGTSIFLKNCSLFEIKLESSGLRRKGAILLCPQGSCTSASAGLIARKKDKNRSMAKQKPTPFPLQDRWKEGR